MDVFNRLHLLFEGSHVVPQMFQVKTKIFQVEPQKIFWLIFFVVQKLHVLPQKL
jgi:hypothetical protein